MKVSQHWILSTWWSGVSARNRREIHVLWKDPRACDQTRTAWDLTPAHYIMQRSLEFGVHVHAVLCLSDGERAVGFWWGVGPCDKWSGWGHAGASEAQLLFGIIYRCENCLLDSLEVFSTDGTCLKAGNLHMSVWHQLSKCSPQMVEVKYFEPTFLLQPWLLRNIIAHISLKSPMIWGIIRWLKNKRCRTSYLSNIILWLAVCKKCQGKHLKCIECWYHMVDRCSRLFF